jgi:putative transposase
MLQEFMRSIEIRYSVYFNKKYKHKGVLWESVYKATTIDADEDLLNVSRYIHRNPIHIVPSLAEAWSSYGSYLGSSYPIWLQPEHVLDLLKPGNLKPGSAKMTYKEFVEWDNPNLDDSITSDLILESPEDD